MENNIDKFLDELEDKKLANILRNILAFKSDYDHNHNEKYVKLDTVYTREEIDAANKMQSLNLLYTNENDNSEITKLTSEWNSFKENFSSYNKDDIPKLVKEIELIKEENSKLKSSLETLSEEISKISNEINPLLERKNALIFSADNIINKIRI